MKSIFALSISTTLGPLGFLAIYELLLKHDGDIRQRSI
jgi:hypothetical protein